MTLTEAVAREPAGRSGVCKQSEGVAVASGGWGCAEEIVFCGE